MLNVSRRKSGMIYLLSAWPCEPGMTTLMTLAPTKRFWLMASYCSAHESFTCDKFFVF